MFSGDVLKEIRQWEITRVAQYLPLRARILEIGAGTGQQALLLSEGGFDVTAIECPSSPYRESCVFPVHIYDGIEIPFPDRSFDVVFSSNVLEHIAEFSQAQAEILRVLKPGGLAVHVLPTPAWRIWTILTAFPAAAQYIKAQKHWLVPRLSTMREFRGAWSIVGFRLVNACIQHRHGAHGNTMSEIWRFHPGRWRKEFRASGFDVEHDAPMGLFYTGNMVMGKKWSIGQRVRMAAFLGSACHLFVLRAATMPPGSGI